MDFFADLFNNNLQDIIIAVVVATFYILLGLDDDIKSEKYLKKFNVLLYLLLILITAVIELPALLIIILYLFIFFISSLNMIELASSIEKNLSHKDLIIFSFIKWFFYTKIYIFIFFASISFVSLFLTNNISISIVVLIIGLFIHQISFAKDKFDYKDFDFMYKKLTDISGFTLDSEIGNDYFTLLGFIIFLEDKDYFNRNGLRFEIKPVIVRNKQRYLGTLKVLKHRILSPHNLKRLFKRYWRGYSSIEMQTIRRTVLEPDSYRYTIRRKILIEHFYTEYFYRAITKSIQRYNEKAYRNQPEETNVLIHSNIKTLFLLYYYLKIKEKPRTIEEFKKNNDSRLDMETYNEFEKIFYEDEFNIQYSSLVRDNWEKFNMIHYPGRVIMKMSQIKYGKEGSISYESSEGRNQFIEYDGASKPMVSSDNKKFIYISPYEWETDSKLYLFDLVKLDRRLLIAPKKDDIPKRAIWVSENLIAVIIGYGSGTVSIGGDVFIYDLNTDECKQITKYGDNVQITDLKLSSYNILELKGIRYIDEQYSEYVDFEKTISPFI